ncbi:exodeoxyribonuclease VII large subunit, partial [Bradyrhizobium sp.]
RERDRTERLADRAARALATSISRLSARVDHAGQLLAALSYRSVLARGFALVRDDAGHPLHQAASIGPNAALSIEFADGVVAATAAAGRAAPVAAPPKTARETKPAAAKRSPDPADQGSLF